MVKPARAIHHKPSNTYMLHYNNKHMVCFFDDACYRYFLLRLFNSLQQFHVELHAYCLIESDVYCLLTPGTPYGIDNLWKAIVEQYNNYYAVRFSRSIRIINSPYACIEAGTANKVMELQRHIERIPLEKLQADHPGTHPWSSYCDNGFGNSASWLRPHPEYQQFLHDNKHGYEQYRAFIAAPPQASTIAALSDKSVRDHTMGR